MNSKPDVAFLDPDALQNLCSQHGDALVLEIFEIFKKYDVQMDAIKDSLRAGEFSKLKFLAHKLKASAHLLGAHRLGEYCRQVEDSPGDESATTYMQRLAEMKNLYQQSVTSIESYFYKYKKVDLH